MKIYYTGYLLFCSLLLLTTLEGADVPDVASPIAESVTAIPSIFTPESAEDEPDRFAATTLEVPVARSVPISTAPILMPPSATAVRARESSAPAAVAPGQTTGEGLVQQDSQQEIKSNLSQAQAAVPKTEPTPATAATVPTPSTSPTKPSEAVTPPLPVQPAQTKPVETLPAEVTPTPPAAEKPVAQETLTPEVLAPVVAAQKEKKALDELVQKIDQQELKKTSSQAQTATPKEGIDTIDIEEGGNWLLKRKALEDTVDTIEQISRVFTKMIEAVMNLRIKHNQLNNEYDIFLTGIGFDLGDMDKLLSDLLEELERERKREGDLTDEERNLMSTIEEKKKEIQQLQESLKMLHDLDAKIVDSMMTMEKQVETANTYQNQAWKNFQVIKKVLSDEKAEELYYNTEGLFKSIQSSYQYVKNSLSNYFNEQSEALRKQMTAIKTSIASLQENGIDLKKELEKAEQLDQERDEKRMHGWKSDSEIKKEPAETNVKTEVKKEQSGFFTSLKNFFHGLIQGVVNAFYFLINGIKGLFVKK